MVNDPPVVVATDYCLVNDPPVVVTTDCCLVNDPPVVVTTDYCLEMIHQLLWPQIIAWK